MLTSSLFSIKPSQGIDIELGNVDINKISTNLTVQDSQDSESKTVSNAVSSSVSLRLTRSGKVNRYRKE